MKPRPAKLGSLLAEAWRTAPTRRRAVRWILEFVGLRFWATAIACFPIEANLNTAGWMGRIWWLLLRRHRERAMENLRPALGATYGDPQLRLIARRSFEHFARLYLVELVMTPRLVNEWTWARYVELGNLAPALRQLLMGRGTIMVTPHFGNFELMGFAIARLGIQIDAVMRPLDNPLLNRYLERARREGGLSLIYKKGATEAAPEILTGGGAFCVIADQDAGRKGLFVDFFGRKASTYKSIGLLAMQFKVPIIAGSAARCGTGFRYRISVDRIIEPHEWAERNDPLVWITQTFSKAMEDAIRRNPDQYLWMHRRWKHRPKEELRSAPSVARRGSGGSTTAEGCGKSTRSAISGST